MSEEKHEQIQGEGDYDAAERYTEAAKEFVESGEAAKAVGKLDGQPDPEGDAARRDAAARAKEHDPRETEDFDEAS